MRYGWLHADTRPYPFFTRGITNNNLETIEHIYIDCDNVAQFWRNTENWVRQLYNPQFKISDTGKIFEEKFNTYVKQMILISVKDVIHQKRKHGDQMLSSAVKRSLLRNLHIMRSHEITQNNTAVFDNNWEIVIDFFRTDFCTYNNNNNNNNNNNDTFICCNILITKVVFLSAAFNTY